MKRTTLTELFVLNAYWIGLSFKWNSLHVLILPAMLLHFAPDKYKSTYLGLLTFVGLVIAMILQPISGATSDRWGSKWGRRRPLIFFGTLFDLVFLAILGWAGGLLWLVIGYIGLQISSNLAHGPAQGLIPDNVPREQHGVASGIKNLMDMSGLVISSLVMGRLLDPNALHPILPMGVLMAVLVLSTGVTLLGVREAPTHSQSPTSKQMPLIRNPFSITSLQAIQTSYWWLIASRFTFLLGVYGIQVFAQYYIRDVIDVANPVKLTGDLLAAITLTLIAFAVAGGWLGDRFGHKRILVAASLISAFGCLLLLAARQPNTLLIYGSVFGLGIGLFLTSNWALANSLAPRDQAGQYLGLTNLATAGAGATSRLNGPIIDLLNNAQPGAFYGYTMLFSFSAVCALLSILFLSRLKRAETYAPETS